MEVDLVPFVDPGASLANRRNGKDDDDRDTMDVDVDDRDDGRKKDASEMRGTIYRVADVTRSTLENP